MIDDYSEMFDLPQCFGWMILFPKQIGDLRNSCTQSLRPTIIGLLYCSEWVWKMFGTFNRLYSVNYQFPEKVSSSLFVMKMLDFAQWKRFRNVFALFVFVWTFQIFSFWYSEFTFEVSCNNFKTVCTVMIGQCSKPRKRTSLRMLSLNWLQENF